MAVCRIVANIHAENVALANSFYGAVLDLEVKMDLGWIQTFGNDEVAAPQVSVASEGGGGTPMPDLSVEVDNFDEVLRRCGELGFAIEYGPVSEPWGVRRFYVRDPFGRLVNVLSHMGS